MAETQAQGQRTKSGQFAKKQGAESLAKAKTLTKESVLAGVAKDRASVDTQFNKIAELTQEKLSELEIVTEAVEFQKAEAERIHGVEAISRSIEEANLALETTKAENARKLAEYQKDLASKFEEARIENNQKVQQFEIQRQQTEASWLYAFKQQQKGAQDSIHEEIRVAQQAERVRKEDLERSWSLREQELKTKEQELIDLRTKAANFDAEIKKAESAAEGRAFGIAKKDKDHEIAILNSHHTAQRTVDQNTIANLTAKLTDKDKIIEQLTLQLTQANTAQKEIATKALETAGNVKALADVQTSTALANNGAKRA